MTLYITIAEKKILYIGLYSRVLGYSTYFSLTINLERKIFLTWIQLQCSGDSIYACDMTSDLWSPSAVACTWAAYCKFQRTSSIDGRDDSSEDIHLLAIDITIDNDSRAEVVSTTGSTMRFRPSRLLNDVTWRRKVEKSSNANAQKLDHRKRMPCYVSVTQMHLPMTI